MGRKFKGRVRKREETTLERQNEWIEYYSANNFGLGVECTKCKKWRTVYDYKEPHQVPEDFQCSDTRIDGKIGSCDIPSSLTEDDFAPDKYTPGSLVWAKYSKYPWWPGIVEDNPDIEEYRWIQKQQELYHVTFFGDKVSHAWVKEQKLTPFVLRPKFTVSKKYKEKLEIAIEQAERANAMDIQERLKYFSLAVLYKGRWPKADDFGTNAPDVSNEPQSTNEPSCAGNDSDDEIESEGKVFKFSKVLPSRYGSDCKGWSVNKKRPLQDENGSDCDATISSNTNVQSNLSTESKDAIFPNSQGSVEDSFMSKEESMEIVTSEPNTIPPRVSESSEYSRNVYHWKEENGMLTEDNWYHLLPDYDETRSDDSRDSDEEDYPVFMQNGIHSDSHSSARSDYSDASSGEEDAFQMPSRHFEDFNSTPENGDSNFFTEVIGNKSPDMESGEDASPDNAISGGKFILGEQSLDWNNPNFRLYVYKKSN